MGQLIKTVYYLDGTALISIMQKGFKQIATRIGR